MNPVLPAIADDFAAAVAEVGLAVTAYLLPYGVFQLVYGPVADRVGRVRIIWMALGASAIATFLCAISPDLRALIGFRFLAGATSAAVIPLTFTYIGDTVPYSRRQQAIGYTTIAFSLGNILSAAAGGFLAAFLSWRAIFVIICVISLAISVLISRESASRQRPKRQPASFLQPFKVALADRLHAFFYLMIVVEGMTVFGSLQFFGLVLRERDGFSYTAIGLIITLLGVGTVITGRNLGRLASRFGERKLILAGGTSFAVAFALMATPPPIPFFLIAMFVAGVGFALMHTTFQTRATELAPTARATGIAMFAFSLFLGGSIGSFLIAFAFDNAGFNPTLITLSAVTLVFGMLASWLILPLTEPHIEERVGYTDSGVNP